MGVEVAALGVDAFLAALGEEAFLAAVGDEAFLDTVGDEAFLAAPLFFRIPVVGLRSLGGDGMRTLSNAGTTSSSGDRSVTEPLDKKKDWTE